MPIHLPPQYAAQHYQWPAQPATHYPQSAPAQHLNQSISTPATRKPKNTIKIKITDPRTGEPVDLTEYSAKSTQSQTTQSKAANDTIPVNDAKGHDSTNATTPSRAVTIKAPPTTATGPAIATTTSNQLTTSTTKSTPVAQTTTAQAKPLATIADKTNSVPSDPKDKLVPSAKVTPTAAAVVKTISDKTSSSVASSLAVQNEFAFKVSESLSSSESKSTVEPEVSKIKGANVSTEDKVIKDHKNIILESSVVRENVATTDDQAVENKENISKNDASLDQAKVNIVNEDTNEKGDIVSDEVVINDGKKATSDDSNKESVNESEVDYDGVTLQYEPGQYNPRTKKGKRKYDKKFLMAIYDIVSKEVITSGLDALDYPSGNVDFSPAWQKNLNQGLDSRSNDPLRRPNQQYSYSGRNSDRQERTKKIIPTSSLGQEVELKTVSNPWKPGSVVKDEIKVDDTVADIENLKKQFRSILNKLTPNNFDSLAEKVTTLNIDTEDKLGDVIDIVFAKALSEPGYSVLYGRMCSHLKKISAGKAEFGTTLLKRCQNQFQADIYSGLDLEGRRKKIDEEEDPDKKKHLNEELYEDMYRCRMRGLGLIKFIGELYKIEMLNNAIMFDCIYRLFFDVTDESLECLCDLLATIGEKLDKSSKENERQMRTKQKNQGASKANAYQGGQKSAAAIVAQGPAQQQQQIITSLDPIFEKLHKIRKDNTNPLSLRIRFKLLDICELREKENWQSKKTKDNNPKKIEEIREAHMEKLESERRQNAMGPRRSQEGRRGLGHSSGSSNQISSLANDQGGNRGGGMHMSASSQSICDHSISDNMKSNDLEAQKYFQNTKAIVVSSILKNVSAPSSAASSSSGGLRPASLRKP